MQVLGIGTTGAIMIWFSHPVVFIMAGFGIALTLSSFFRQNWKEIFRQITTYAIWMSSFLVCYVFSLQKLAHDELQLSNFKSTFMPLPPTSISDMRWFLDNLFTTFNNPGGLFFTGLAALVFGVGIVSLYKQKRTSTLMLLLPIPVLLMVSGFHKYPFQDRLLLFIAPIIMLFIAEGLTQIRQITKEAFPAIGIILIFLLFLHPLITATYHLFVPVKIEEIKPVIKYMENNKQGGDTLYLYYSAEPAYRYYSQYLNIEGGKPIIGISSRNNVSKYWDDLDKLRGRGRVWILFSHICTWNGTDEKQHFLSYLDKKGKKIESFVGDGASIYLYSL